MIGDTREQKFFETHYLEAPNRENAKIANWQRTVFLAGSITGAVDWQKEAKEKLLPYFTVFNPRRVNYPSFDPSKEREQILWEHDYLEYASIVLFYFSHETLAPITLFELGKCLATLPYKPYKKIYIAIHPAYKRKNDVIIQTELLSKETSKRTCFSLNEMLELVIKENK
jgi:hypothetical protein